MKKILDVKLIILGLLAAGLFWSSWSLNAKAATDPIALWKFDEASGTTASDSSGNGNNGTLVNSPTWSSGKINGALSFNGSSNYVDMPTTNSLSNFDNISIAFWVKTSTNSETFVVSKGNDWGGVYSIQIRGDAGHNGTVAFRVTTNATVHEYEETTTSVNDGAWHYVAATYDGSKMRIYIDGLETGSGNAVTGSLNTNGTDVLIGRAANVAHWFNGLLDETRIYNRALSGTEIQALYNAGSGSGINCNTPGTNNFTGCYYNTQDFNNLALTRTDNNINFDWGTGSPDPAVNVDHFSVRWQGNFTFNATGYTFSTTADDGVRVYVDGDLIIDKWIDQGSTTYTATKTLTAGTHLVKMEYYENGYDAVAKLSWSAEANVLPRQCNIDQAISRDEIARGVAVDTAGNTYITGFITNAPSKGYCTVKYDNSQNMIWSVVYDGGYNTNAVANAVAVDSSGNVYVTGAFSNGVDVSEYRTIKYNSSGQLVWDRIYPTKYIYGATGIAVDSSGNIYVVGDYWNYSTSDFRIIKYDSAGNILWNITYNNGGQNQHPDIAVDSSGNIYITGYSRVYPSLSSYRTIKYNSSGNLLWDVVYNSGSSDWAIAVAVDSSGNVYVTGLSNNHYRTIKYDGSGNILWNVTYDSGNWGSASDITVDSSGNSYVTGTVDPGDAYTTIKYDSSGNIIWNALDDGFATFGSRVAVDSSNNVFVAGTIGKNGHFRFLLVKHLPPPSPVTSYQSSCSETDTISINWNYSGGATYYMVKADDQNLSPGLGNCGSPGVFCGTTFSDFYQFANVASSIYSTSVAACNDLGQTGASCSDPVSETNPFTCPPIPLADCICGSANDKVYNTQPSVSTLCGDDGSAASSLSGENPWTWTCSSAAICNTVTCSTIKNINQREITP